MDINKLYQKCVNFQQFCHSREMNKECRNNVGVNISRGHYYTNINLLDKFGASLQVKVKIVR